MDEKRTIDGYAVLHAIRIDGAEQIVVEKDSHYRLYRGERVSTLGIEEYTTRINGALDNLGLDRVYRGSPLVDYPLSAEDCVPGGMDADLRGKVVAVRAEILSPEYRACSHQIILATGGFGCSPNARGQSVFAKNLYSGEENRWSRSDILGVFEENALPDWAKEKLAKLREPAPRESVMGRIHAAKAQPERERKSPKSHKSEPER